MPRLWIVPLGVVAGLGAGMLAGAVSRAVVLDLIAWWPVWLALAGVGLVVRAGSNRRIRPGGVVALLATVLSGVFLFGHIAGWAVMPSASQRLVGPEVGDIEVASLAAVIHGRLIVGSGSDFLYVVQPVRWGGEYGLPLGLEEVAGPETIGVTLAMVADPGLQAFAGWDISLATEPIWRLHLGGVISADLSRLNVVHLVMSGSGEVVLGDIEFRGEVDVTGEFQLSFPAGASVTVTGDAVVPEGWLTVEGGWRSPVEGDGWAISVAPGASVEIVGR